MTTTITEYSRRHCSRCGGEGRISAFQHRKGGECFRCGGSGLDPVMVETTRAMTDEEVLAALAAAGFPVIFAERPATGDFLADLFLSPDELAERAAVMAGARAFLAALPAAA